jgi:predicted nucleic-acid-binding protein
MSDRYGIDTSILVRLATGLPETEFEATLQALSAMVEKQGAQLFASSMVIGEAYIALQHHYGISKSDARAGLTQVLTSGLLKPIHGAATLEVIKQAAKGCGLMDRLIAHDYEYSDVGVLTLDKKMARLAGAKRLVGSKYG